MKCKAKSCARDCERFKLQSGYNEFFPKPL